MNVNTMYLWESEEETGFCVHATISIDANVSSFVPAKTDGPPDNCYPAEGGEVEITQVSLIEIHYAFMDGEEIPTPTLTPELKAEIEAMFRKELDKGGRVSEQVDEKLFKASQEDDRDYDYDE